MALLCGKGVAHNLIHRICSELCAVDNCVMPAFCADIYILLESMTWDSVKILAHNLIHRTCAELDTVLSETMSKLHCVIFRQAMKSLSNQWLSYCPMYLLTMLSPVSGDRCAYLGLGSRRPHGPCVRENEAGRSCMNNFIPASFLRMRIFPLRINALSRLPDSCAQSYPQKVCRTVLAVRLATRYIAGVRSVPVSPLLRSLFCSPFFKLQAGQSGYC